uniref:Kinesin-like protein n=1 Tax=Periophthalmus magnuspinnatus TaxID=409849 RepID=A0A3B3ZU66_9GOBI
VKMALTLLSPGFRSDEEDEMAVFESTAAEHGGLGRPRLPEISVISPGLDRHPSTTKVKVYLRIRPLTEVEKDRGEEQGCVLVQDEKSLLLKAPKESQNMRNAERGITQSMHKFSFSKIFGPDTTQQQFYEHTMKTMVKDVLQGENRLLYTYGVTNSGKTYTVQGSGREAGILPRALASMFMKLKGRLYGGMDLKPIMYQDIKQLDPTEVKVEESRRNSLLKEVYQHNLATQLEDVDSVCLEPDSLSNSGGDDLKDGVQFSIWVSYYEIYNEFLYDLLDASPSMQPRKRVTLRLGDDKQGNPYVKDLTWIQVCSAEEAWRVLTVGRRNQSFACTHLNQNSSRSHSIFSIRILHVHPESVSDQAMRISELTICDLAGSERCKEQRNGERMKEANNINTSLLTLGRCIAALRHNQNNRSRPPQVVPFRDSKLTRVLQGFFCGKGTSSMVVNINPCASIYDETLQALKFSAIATQVILIFTLVLMIFFCFGMSKALLYILAGAWPINQDQSGLYSVSERDQEIEALSAALEKQKTQSSTMPDTFSEVPRRSQRLTVNSQLSSLRYELDQCRVELLTKTEELAKLKTQLEVPGSAGALTNAADRKLEEGQRNLRQLRQDLHRLGMDLQSGERACCRNTGGERLRQALTTADETLAKQDQILVELQNNLLLVKADLRRKAETLVQTQPTRPLPPPSGYPSAMPGSCMKRGCAAAVDNENRPPEKRQFFHSLFPTRTPNRKYNTRTAEEASVTPYSRILRSRQQSPPPSPVPTPRRIRGKY